MKAYDNNCSLAGANLVGRTETLQHTDSGPGWRDALKILLLCAALTLAGCGGGNDTTVAGDDASNANGSNNGGNSNNPNPGSSNNPAGNGADSAPQNGDPLIAIASALPREVTYECKTETSAGSAVQEQRRLTFSRASLTFSVDGMVVLQDGFTWNEATMEWTASTLQDSNGLIQETFAKVDPANMPTYYRSKLTRPDFSFEQTECYLGLAVHGPFFEGIPDNLAEQDVACRQVQTTIGGSEILSDSGVVQQTYQVRDGTFYASLISDALDTAAIVVMQPLAPTSERTVLANGDIRYASVMTASFTRRSELVVDAIGRFKYARATSSSRTGDFETYCGDNADTFFQ